MQPMEPNHTLHDEILESVFDLAAADGLEDPEKLDLDGHEWLVWRRQRTTPSRSQGIGSTVIRVAFGTSGPIS